MPSFEFRCLKANSYLNNRSDINCSLEEQDEDAGKRAQTAGVAVPSYA